MNAKPRIKPLTRRPTFKTPMWECSSSDDHRTFRIARRGQTPREAYELWFYSNQIPW